MKSVFFFKRCRASAFCCHVICHSACGGGWGWGVVCGRSWVSFTVRFSDFVEVFVCDPVPRSHEDFCIRRSAQKFHPNFGFHAVTLLLSQVCSVASSDGVFP